MLGRRHALLTFLAFLALLSTALAASPASFCKCTCFTNSTIIHLDDPSPYGSKSGSSKSSSNKGSGSSIFSRAKDSKKGKRSCNDCNKKFCLDYNLPICHGAKEEDVYTECFQRDSAKDQAVVVIFITATVSLLVYAAARPYIDRWQEKVKERRSYIPVSTQGEQ
ncbi:Cytochrome P450 [Macrophomina phaseolina MS6]|uniref:Cytochrome P450 n=2 Tax=Macrophomina phaseolina TaxID=35725 RepID=K2ST46_MACPH|nr:Cytochrome P450 [Macrophomina phaseolina MS6]KAH7045260.1 hypothetical protein B0J12DRAFT_670066 [Macrophomina phaseolina]